MNKKYITIHGKQYPIALTMGAMLRFKRETGKDVSEIKSQAVADSIILLWCMTASACKDDGVEFPYDIESFADALSPDNLALVGEVAGEGDGQKKTAE